MTDLQQIKDRLAKITPGKWGIERTQFTNFIGPMLADKVEEIVASIDRYYRLKIKAIQRSDANADFIAHAPEAIHRLIAEVERLDKELDDCRQFLQIEPAQNVAEYLKLAIPNLERGLRAWRECAEQLGALLERELCGPPFTNTPNWLEHGEKCKAALARLKALKEESK